MMNPFPEWVPPFVRGLVCMSLVWCCYALLAGVLGRWLRDWTRNDELGISCIHGIRFDRCWRCRPRKSA